jgi:hypothetical protein
MGAYAVAAGVVLAPLAPAFADTTVTVRGTSFPTGPAAQLSFVGCADPYDRTAEALHPYVGIGPQQAPAGRRSLGYDLAGGNAVGSLHYLSSVTATSVAGMSVFAADGASGVTYFGYQAPADRGTGRVWFGRADLSVPAGAWADVDVRGLTFTWHEYDMVAMRALDGATADGGTATVDDFVAAHGGDGPGFVTIGFGCDGRPFSMDAWRVGAPGSVTTYDLEGLATSTSIDGPSGSVDAGTPVTLRGDLSVIGGDLGPARLVLERRTAHGGWAIVQGVDTVAGQPVELTVRPDATTTYRWELVDRPLAEGSASAPLTVQVNGSPGGSGGPSDQPAPSQQPTPSQSPTPSSHPTPSQHPTPSSTPKPTSTPTSTPTSKPTSTPTSKPTSKPTGQPTAGPTSAPTATSTGTPSAASSTLPSAGLSASASASPSTGGSAVPAP